MEATSRGEVRRIHIIYFLSHMGRVDHPHLIRVHHLHRNGVHLRDVKRWLADLRGKDMPDAFAWSYKRRYKSGYVWQDLIDDDLITPISDNEYVLKGSEIFPTSPLDASGAHCERKSFTSEDHKQSEEYKQRNEQPEENQTYIDPRMDTPTKTSSEICQEYSPVFSSENSSSLTDDSIKQEDGPTKQDSDEQQSQSFENQPPYLYSNNLPFDDKKSRSEITNNKKIYNGNTGEKLDIPSPTFSSLSSSESTFGKSKSHSSRASKMLRNLITCGAVDTNDAVLVALNKSSLSKPIQRREHGAEICKDETLGGSAWVFAKQWNQHHQHYNTARKGFDGSKRSKEERQQSKLCSVAYKPVGAPTCSQCRKSFKPEKLHAHMKSCRGMKSFATTASVSMEKASHRSKHNQLVIVS